MPKYVTTIYTCAECDAQFPKWVGQCAECGRWGTVAQSAAPQRKNATATRIRIEDIPTLDAVGSSEILRRATGISEFDTAIGGGIAPGTLLLLAGEPGIGKSTLVLQVAAAMATHGDVLYVSGEETASQLHERAKRLGVDSARIRLLATNDAAIATAAIERLHPAFAVVDSIQTLHLPDIPVDAGGVSQVRALTNRLREVAKTTDVPLCCIGHVTKDGTVAGPKTLEHLVDQVAILEGEATSDLRVLRTTKNRYGPTDVVGVFSMSEQGLRDCADPAAAFLGQLRGSTAGTMIAVPVLGTRALLVEIQALVTRSAFGQPQRRAIGLDINRLHVLIAVLAQHAGCNLASMDVHVATGGGFRIDDPATDLAIAGALLSATAGRPLPIDVCIGEVRLDGAVRPGRSLERRIREATRLGRQRVATPPLDQPVTGVSLRAVATVRDLAALLA